MAATLSTWVSCSILIGLMLKRQVLHPSDLAKPPTVDEVVPYLWKGAVLAFRMIVTFGECCWVYLQLAVLGSTVQLKACWAVLVWLVRVATGFEQLSHCCLVC